MKKLTLWILISVLLLVCFGYLYFRFKVLKADDQVVKQESSSIIDLRPALVAKLQQVVKDGSDGLYRLSVDKFDPDIIEGKILFTGIKITADSTALLRLDSARALPDDVLKITLDTLSISGLNLADVLPSGNIRLKNIFINDPVIEVYHHKRNYNKEKRKAADSVTLYTEIQKELSDISLDTILIQRGTIKAIDVLQKNKTTTYNGVSMHFTGLKIDSATQYDRTRFLFATNARLSIRDFVSRTADSLYTLSCGFMEVAAERQELTIKDLQLKPRYSKQGFSAKLTSREDMYTLKVPRLVFTGVDWWQLANYNKLIADKADLYNCYFSDYLNRSIPSKKSTVVDNFPHQSILRMKMPLYIGSLRLHNMRLDYEEFNPVSEKSATIYFDRMNGTISNLTNIKESISKNSITSFKVNTLFMRKVPARIRIDLDLARVKTGSFSAQVGLGQISNDLVNPVAEPLGLLTMKRGKVNKLTAKMKGDNRNIHSDFTMLYDDLYVVPLKKEEEETVKLKKRGFTGFLANLLVIKNANPDKKGNVRSFSYDVKRSGHPNFFNYLWKTILLGIVETIGAPKKLAG